MANGKTRGEGELVGKFSNVRSITITCYESDIGIGVRSIATEKDSSLCIEPREKNRRDAKCGYVDQVEIARLIDFGRVAVNSRGREKKAILSCMLPERSSILRPCGS